MNMHTRSMVSSDDVNGTTVFGTDGTEVGTIDHLIIDKQSGKVAYAVMAFGGFLGMGQDEHQIPWGALKYDTSKGGYVTNITQEQLSNAPARPENWAEDRAWEQRTYDYYGQPYYWF